MERLHRHSQLEKKLSLKLLSYAKTMGILKQFKMLKVI